MEQHPTPRFSLLLELPLEITKQIFLQFLNGKSLSTLALALYTKQQLNDDDDDDTSNDNDNEGKDDEHQHQHQHQHQHNCSMLRCRRDGVIKLIHQVAKKRLLNVALVLEHSAAVSSQSSNNNNNNKIYRNDYATLTVPALNWIRSVVDFSFIEETSPLECLRVLSENLALVDFLEYSLNAYSCPERGQFEWPVWVGPITIETTYVAASRLRMRHTARIVITAPMMASRPSFLLPGCCCNWIPNSVPKGGMFRVERYNMIPVPPWGRIRAFTEQDARVLKPVAERLSSSDNQHVVVAVPMHRRPVGNDYLDIRIASTSKARELLQQMSWTPRGSWILDAPSAPSSSSSSSSSRQPQEKDNTGLVCVWQEETLEMHSDRQYLAYIIDLLKALDRMNSTTT